MAIPCAKYCPLTVTIPAPKPRTSVLQHVSANIRRLRHAAGFSQTTLAQMSGVSRRMLVAIEGGENNVSLSTLDRLAEALGVAFSLLIQAPDQRNPARIDELVWTGAHPGSTAVLLASASARSEVELWEWRLEPAECYRSAADPLGWSEQLFVFEGTLTVILDEQTHTLRAGEFLMYASDVPHVYRNDASVPVRFMRNVVL